MTCNLFLLKNELKYYWSRFSYRFKFKNKSTFNTNDLKKILKKMGVKEGENILVQSSTDNLLGDNLGSKSIVYSVEIVNMLIELVGKEGHILMPSYPGNGLSAYKYFISNPVFNVRKTPSSVGLISEVFRRTKGVQRSLNPARPVCVWGKNSKDYVLGHIDSPIIDGVSSPYYKLYQNGGKIIMLGTVQNSITHLPEAIVSNKIKEEFLFSKTTKLRYIDNDGKENIYDAYLNLPIPKGYYKYVEYIYLKYNCMIKYNFVNTIIQVVDVKLFVDGMIKELDDNGLSLYSPEFF